MAEIQHTPGPWRAEKWLCHLATSVTVDDASIVTGKRLIVECETEEDARLIAASPDLLDAAQAAEAVLARGRWIEGSTDPEAVALAKLRAAITKAAEVRHGKIDSPSRVQRGDGMDVGEQQRAILSAIEVLAHIHRLSEEAQDGDDYLTVVVLQRYLLPTIGVKLDDVFVALGGIRTGFFDEEVRHA